MRHQRLQAICCLHIQDFGISVTYSGDDHARGSSSSSRGSSSSLCSSSSRIRSTSSMSSSSSSCSSRGSSSSSSSSRSRSRSSSRFVVVEVVVRFTTTISRNTTYKERSSTGDPPINWGEGLGY